MIVDSAVSERLGHGNPAFIIDTRHQVLAGMQAEAARTYERHQERPKPLVKTR